MKKTPLFFLFIFFSNNVLAQLSTTERIQLAQRELVETAEQIHRFFERYREELTDSFSSEDIDAILSLEGLIRFEIVDQNVLLDRNNIGRDCTNRTSSPLHIITCKLSYMTYIRNDPTRRFILVLHEMLGIKNLEIGLPENSPLENYEKSSRIASYITSIGQTSLVYQPLEEINSRKCRLIFHSFRYTGNRSYLALQSPIDSETPLNDDAPPRLRNLFHRRLEAGNHLIIYNARSPYDFGVEFRYQAYGPYRSLSGREFGPGYDITLYILDPLDRLVFERRVRRTIGTLLNTPPRLRGAIALRGVINDFPSCEELRRISNNYDYN